MKIPTATTILAASLFSVSHGSPGCRAPSDTYLSPDGTAIDCTSCAEEFEEGCQIMSWQGFGADEGPDRVVPWYNVVKFGWDNDCDFESTPPCASCSLRDEEEMSELVAPDDTWTEERCNALTDMDLLDPCFARMSGECFCDRAMALVERCPNLPSPYPARR